MSNQDGSQPMMLTTSSLLNTRHPSDRRELVIGLVNNMPDGALHATERQFQGLLIAASPDFPICLRLFSLPGVPRGDQAQLYVSQYYEHIGHLWSGRLDGLIVTGTEPRARSLANEPYWPALKQLVDEAEDHAISTVWSCLAAHAAVLHMNGVQRRPLREKLSGVFECTKIGDHEILADAPLRWCVPHSRQNGLPEEALVSKGYRILSGSLEVGADMFVKEGRSLFIFLQGHPEYDPDALFREYRRDVRRFLAAERDDYPSMPRGYFESDTEAAFAVFRERAMRDRSSDLLLHFPQASGKADAWREPAVHWYGHWLSYLAQRSNAQHCL